MIRFENLTKVFQLPGGGRKVVARNITLTLPPRVSVGLLGRNGAGKSTLMEMISGTIKPTRGRIIKTGSVSWPIGFQGSFHPDMSGAQNTRFIARVYGVDTEGLVDFVEDFAELGRHFHAPMRTYSSGMKSRLAFGVSVGIPFETYLVDEVTSVGDASFRAKSKLYFEDRMKAAGALFVSHSMSQLREYCQAGMVLEDGRLRFFDKIEDAIRVHERNLAVA